MPHDFAPDRKRYSICSNAKQMAPDIDRALHRIVAKPGGMDEARARTGIQERAETGRYRKGGY
jgi:sulfite reductase alpha subunit-like flavoprotein